MINIKLLKNVLKNNEEALKKTKEINKSICQIRRNKISIKEKFEELNQFGDIYCYNDDLKEDVKTYIDHFLFY